MNRDVRRDHPYAAYDGLSVKAPVYQEGDVLRRVMVRADEIRESLRLIRAVARWATSVGAQRVYLFVQESNAPGRALYERASVEFFARRSSRRRNA